MERKRRATTISNNISENNKTKKYLKKKRLKRTLNIILVISVSIFVICTFNILKWLIQNSKSNNILEETIEIAKIEEINGDVIEQINPPIQKELYSSDYANDYFYYMSIPFVSVDFEELKNKNSDTVAWLKVMGTDVNYPVVQTSDNSYYLTHAYDHTNNSAGWIFGDFRCDFEEFGRNTIIYGHSRRNNTMFGSLLGTTNKNWCSNRDNTIVHLSTPKYNTMWQIFSIYTIEKEAEYLTTYFETEEIYSSFLNNMKDRSIFNFNCNVDNNDRILTLSTCAKDDKYRVVIQAKLIKRELR